MKLEKQTQYVVLNDDGTPVHPATAKSVYKMMDLFASNSVNGDTSYVSPDARFRMAMTILDNYTVKPKSRKR